MISIGYNLLYKKETSTGIQIGDSQTITPDEKKAEAELVVDEEEVRARNKDELCEEINVKKGDVNGVDLVELRAKIKEELRREQEEEEKVKTTVIFSSPSKLVQTKVISVSM